MAPLWPPSTSKATTRARSSSNIEAEALSVTIESLATEYGIEVEGAEHASKAKPVSATIQGSLKEILARLLKNWNHIIVSDPDDPDRMEKIIILNDDQVSRSPAAKAPPPPASPEIP
ncbi:hypothetical protein [Hyphomicrobium sp. 99]|uniref:hypothetical protein n=1 Tax=Hyphomicrobium sp. 99 TaxID=1163419 RepID=UPI0005F80518|nr:hypothetical protein [Hyphomicrobium sp. 99]